MAVLRSRHGVIVTLCAIDRRPSRNLGRGNQPVLDRLGKFDRTVWLTLRLPIPSRNACAVLAADGACAALFAGLLRSSWIANVCCEAVRRLIGNMITLRPGQLLNLWLRVSVGT